MDIRFRSLVLLVSFFFLGMTISPGKVQGTGCSETIGINRAYPDRDSVEVYCGFEQWRIGYDLDVCNQSIFMDYDKCNPNLARCMIPLADYNNRGPTVFSCTQLPSRRQVYTQIIIPANASHQVPLVTRVGHREVAYTFFTVKPYPVDPPGAHVSLAPLLNNNASGTTVTLDVTTEVIPHPQEPFKYVAVHSFDMPSDVDHERTIVRIDFSAPTSWESIGDQSASYSDIAIIKVPDVDPPSSLPSSTTLSSTVPPTEGEESTSATAICHGSDTLALAVVGSSVPSVIIAVTITLICSVCILKKKQNKTNSKSSEDIQYGNSPPVPNNLPLHPVTSTPLSASAGGTCTNSTVTTPGLTPVSISESTRLLSGLAGQSRVTGASADSTVTVNPCFQSQLSKDSTSIATTSPMDSEGGLSSQAATPASVCNSIGAMSGGLVVVGGGPAVASNDGSGMDDTAMTVVSSSGSGCGMKSVKGSTDPKTHIYSTIDERKLNSLTDGVKAVGRDGQQKSSQLNQQTGQYQAIMYNHSGVPASSFTSSSPSLSTNGGMSSIFPPLPPADPNYASGGRNMHLPNQYYKETNATNV